MSSVDEICQAALVELAIDFPTYAHLIAKIGVQIDTTSKLNALAWTDGTRITLNSKLIEENNAKGTIELADGQTVSCTIGKRELMFILSHELLHLIGLTFDRGQNLGLSRIYGNRSELRKHKLWNMATDYEINALLSNNKVRMEIGTDRLAPVGRMPEVALYESKYADLTAEEIYADLLKQDEEKESQEISMSVDGSGEDEEGDGNADAVADGFGFSLDHHMPILDDATRNEMLAKMSEVFGSTSNGTGSSAFDRMIGRAFKKQPFNWRRALTRYIRNWMKDSYTWSKPSRAGIANGLILPSSGRVPKMHIAVAVDTSGSICNDELQAMMDHLFTILSQFKDFTVDLWCCGSRVYEETFMRLTGQNKSDVTKFGYKSDGGNDMRKNFEFIKQKYKSEKLDLFMCMTDGYDPCDGDTETTCPCNVVWLMLDHPSFVPPKLMRNEVYPFEVNASKGH